jgi:hypothetical protein
VGILDNTHKCFSRAQIKGRPSLQLVSGLLVVLLWSLFGFCKRKSKDRDEKGLASGALPRKWPSST